MAHTERCGLSARLLKTELYAKKKEIFLILISLQTFIQSLYN